MKKLILAAMILLSSCKVFQGYSCPAEKTIVNSGAGFHQSPPKEMRFK